MRSSHPSQTASRSTLPSHRGPIAPHQSKCRVRHLPCQPTGSTFARLYCGATTTNAWSAELPATLLSRRASPSPAFSRRNRRVRPPSFVYGREAMTSTRTKKERTEAVALKKTAILSLSTHCSRARYGRSCDRKVGSRLTTLLSRRNSLRREAV